MESNNNKLISVPEESYTILQYTIQGHPFTRAFLEYFDCCDLVYYGFYQMWCEMNLDCSQKNPLKCYTSNEPGK